MYDSEVFKITKTLKPSNRGELEVTDVNNAYLKKVSLLTIYSIVGGRMQVRILMHGLKPIKQWQNMGQINKILVTGAAGFIGSNFIKYLLKTHKSYRIINLDKLTYAGNLDNLKEIKNNSRYKFVKGDISNEKLVNQLVKDVDAIIHFAAESHVDRSIGEPSPFLKTKYFWNLCIT